jgi:hypothetical protein
MINTKTNSGSVNSYDCFYLKSGGEFRGFGDGGFINVSYHMDFEPFRDIPCNN